MQGSAAVVGWILGNHRLRRVELAFVGFSVSEYAVWTAILVYAYHRGGATASGLIAVVQLAPAAVVAPFAAGVADSRGGAFALVLGYVLQAASTAAAAVVMLTGGPAVAAYLAAVVAASAVTFTRPAQAKLLSSLVERPEELTAATAVSGWIEGASALGGPALAGVIIAVGSPGLVFAVFAAALAGSALLVADTVSVPDARPSEEETLGAGILAGLRALRTERSAQALVMIIAAEHVAIGALDVIVVVLAISALHIGSPGAGYLNALFGLGATLGGVIGVVVIGARAVSVPLVAAGLGWAISFTIVGASPTLLVAILFLPVAGGGQALVDTAGRALLARVTPHEVLARVFGVLEGLSQAGLALGALLVPILVSVGGVRLALIGVAAVLAVASLAPRHAFRELDAFVPKADAMRLLRGHRLFAGLPPAVLEGLARELAAEPMRAGRVVIAEGDVGDLFYLVAEGELEVSIAGEHIRRLGPGDGFGEIALLHNVLRTASVTASSDGLLYALARDPFRDALRPAI